MERDILNVRIDKSLKDRLKRQAEAENRTLSNLVETVLRLYLEQREQSPKNRRG